MCITYIYPSFFTVFHFFHFHSPLCFVSSALWRQISEGAMRVLLPPLVRGLPRNAGHRDLLRYFAIAFLWSTMYTRKWERLYVFEENAFDFGWGQPFAPKRVMLLPGMPSCTQGYFSHTGWHFWDLTVVERSIISCVSKGVAWWRFDLGIRCDDGTVQFYMPLDARIEILFFH